MCPYPKSISLLYSTLIPYTVIIVWWYIIISHMTDISYSWCHVHYTIISTSSIEYISITYWHILYYKMRCDYTITCHDVRMLFCCTIRLIVLMGIHLIVLALLMWYNTIWWCSSDVVDVMCDNRYAKVYGDASSLRTYTRVLQVHT